jgi:pimeloyl-ACP methyl ester carboxylesterase
MYRHDDAMTDYALLLHGAASTCDFMSRHFPPSLLGVHTTISPQQMHDERAYVDCLLHLVGRLGTPTVVCGVSLGAHIAVALAHRIRPDLLALCLPAALAGEPAEHPRATPVQAAPEHFAALGVEHEDPAADWVSREVARARDLLADADLRDGLARGHATTGPTYTDLALIAVPTVIVGWPDDPLHPLTVAERWHAAFPDARLVVVNRGDAESDPYLLARAITGSR